MVIVSELDQLFMEFLLKNKFTRIARTHMRKTEMELAFRLSGLIHVMAMEALEVGVRKDTQPGNSGCDRGGLRVPVLRVTHRMHTTSCAVGMAHPPPLLMGKWRQKAEAAHHLTLAGSVLGLGPLSSYATWPWASPQLEEHLRALH